MKEHTEKILALDILCFVHNQIGICGRKMQECIAVVLLQSQRKSELRFAGHIVPVEVSDEEQTFSCKTLEEALKTNS